MPYTDSQREDILQLISCQPRKALDVGCADGTLGESIKTRFNAQVTGIDFDPDLARPAKKILDKVLIHDLETGLPDLGPDKFDLITCGDVLEHLKNPWDTLKQLRQHLSPKGQCIISLPNVGFFGVIHQLIEGKWEYQEEGLMDKTHLRFFTYASMLTLIEDAGLEIVNQAHRLDPSCPSMDSFDSTLNFNMGNISIKDLPKERFYDFFVIQYVFATRLKTRTAGL